MSASSRSPLVISIDCDPRLAPADMAGRRTVETAAMSLADRLAESRIPATWAATRWTFADLGGRLAASGHELAVLADSTWAGPTVTRTRLSNEWNARSADLRALGRTATSLVLGDGSLTEQLDLLVKFGVTAVRLPHAEIETPQRRGALAGVGKLLRGLVASRFVAAQPRPVRWGISELPVSLVLPEVTAREAQRTIERAIVAGVPLHVVVDLPQCTFGRSARLSSYDRLFAYLARRAGENRLELKTMSTLVGELAQGRERRPAQSILRRAA